MASLYVLRFIACVGIFLHHLNYPNGYAEICVTFFFVLSGFTMAYSMNNKNFVLNKNSFGQFLKSKFIKVYPLYFITFLASIPVMRYHKFDVNGFDALVNVFMLQTSFPNGNKVFMFNGLSWFISDIMFFYIITPFVFHLLKKFKLKNNSKFLTLAIVILISFTFYISYYFKGNVSTYSFSWWIIYISPYFRILNYLVGFMLGLLFICLKDKILNKSKNVFIFSVIEILSLILLYLSHESKYMQIDSLKCGAYYIPISIFIIFIFAFGRGIVSRIFSLNPLVYLGKLSPIIYMIHNIIINYMFIIIGSPLFNINQTMINNLKLAIFLFFFVLCVSDVINRYFIPLTKIKLKIVKEEHI